MLPIVYSPKYNISLFGLQKLHPFDSEKYGRVFKLLIEKGVIQKEDIHVPKPVTEEQLLMVHSKEYLKSLRRSKNVARIAELALLKWVPNILLRWRLLRPMRYGTGGTLLGLKLALEHGWAVNLSGGYHHAKSESSSGFCFYADIPIAAYTLLQENPKMKKVMVIDLDAHQGNGFESVFGNDDRFVSFDVYNGEIYPYDYPAREFIRYNYPIGSGTVDLDYLALIKAEIPKAIDAENPDFIFYNAGTDIYSKDPLGSLGVSAEGILVRDHLVMEHARKRGIPILMVLSGGYTEASAGIIASSIQFFIEKLDLASGEQHQA